jgi:hypothetical protein
MKYLSKKIISFLFICVTINSYAQKGNPDGLAIHNRDFSDVDEYVKKLGSLDSLTMGAISNIVTKNYTNKTDKVRAIYDWVAYNISYDIKTARNGGAEKNSSTEVLLYRKATGIGYANLFQDMCSSAGIRCLTANGYIKFGSQQINESKPEINHSWAVVQLGESPDAWYYADPCMGSGYTDAEFKNFTKSFNPDYFFADLTIFNWQHYPDNTAWQLGPGPRSKKDFFDMPVIKSAAYEFGLKKMNPVEGAIKVKVNKAFAFSYQIRSSTNVEKVSLMIGEGKKKKIKEVPFSFNNSLLGFTYKFEEEDTFPLTILINGKELIEYMVDVQ